MPCVLLINPNTSSETTAMMHGILRDDLPPAVDVQSATATRGASMITNEQDLAISVEEVIRMAMSRGPEVSAIIIGAFGDPALQVVRRTVGIPVVGIGEASMREAAAGGRRFGVATTTRGLDESIARAVAAYGLAPFFTGTRIPDADPLALAAQPELQDERLAEAAQHCIDDGARAVVIGGGPLSAAARQIAPRFDVPVISAVGAASRAVQRLMIAERKLRTSAAVNSTR